MRADPEPEYAVRNWEAHRAIVEADANRKVTASRNLPEVKRWVVGLSSQQSVIPARVLLDLGRKGAKSVPEPARSEMPQISDTLPR